MRQMMVVAGALALVVLAGLDAAPAHAQSRDQLRVLDRVAGAKIAAEKCPNLQFEAAASEIAFAAARIDVSRDPFATPWAGRLFSTRYLWDLDKDPRACEKALASTNLLSRR